MGVIEVAAARAPAGSSGATVTAEVADAARFSRLGAHWESLVTRAALPNVSMHPAVVRAAADAGAAANVVLAWRGDDPVGARVLVGVWVLGVGRLSRRWSPSVLIGPADRNLILGAPVVDRDAVEEVLSAMLDALASARGLPAILHLKEMPVEGPVYRGLRRVLAARRAGVLVRRRLVRPKLTPGPDADGFLNRVLSAKRRGDLRRCRRRLAELGAVEVTVHRTGPEVTAAFETFLSLEAAGWKGRAGTALARREDGSLLFVRRFIGELADEGLVTIMALRLDDRVVAMEVLLRCRGVLHTWKSAYDEDLRPLGPGFLLFEEVTRALLADPSLRLADMSNNREFSDPNGVSAFWPERHEVVDLLVGVRGGRAGGFYAAAVGIRLGRAYRALVRRLREAAKKNSPGRLGEAGGEPKQREGARGWAVRWGPLRSSGIAAREAVRRVI